MRCTPEKRESLAQKRKEKKRREKKKKKKKNTSASPYSNFILSSLTATPSGNGRRAAMMMGMTAIPATATTPPLSHFDRLADHTAWLVNAVCQKSRPEKENDFHDPNSKTRLQQSTGFVQVLRQRVVVLCALCPERSQRAVYTLARTPMRAACIGDEI